MSKNSHAVAWAPDAPTPAQLSELFCQFKANRITKSQVQSFLRRSNILRPISYPGPFIEINALNGTRTIAKSERVNFLVDGHFSRIGVNQPGSVTKKILAKIYALEKDASLLEMFNSLSDNLHELCLTQHQILYVIENFSNHLISKWGTFFLFITEKNLFNIAKITRTGDGTIWDMNFYLRQLTEEEFRSRARDLYYDAHDLRLVVPIA